MEISVECDSPMNYVAMHRRCTCTDHVVWNFLSPATLPFFFYLALYYSLGTRSRSFLLSLSFLYLYFSTPSGLTFRRRIALSSVVFIVCGVDDEDATRWDEVLLRRTAIRPGRLAARLRVNVLLVISGLATSSTLSPPSFLDLLPENRLSPCPPFHCRPFSSIRTRSTSRHRPCKLESSRGSVLAANSRVLDEIDRIRERDDSISEFSIVGFKNQSILLDPRGDLRGEYPFWKGSVAKQSLPLSSKRLDEVSSTRVRFDYDGILNASRDFEMLFPFLRPWRLCLVIVRSFIRLSKNKARDVSPALASSPVFFFIFRSAGRKYLATYEMSRRKRRRGVPINSGPVSFGERLIYPTVFLFNLARVKFTTTRNLFSLPAVIPNCCFHDPWIFSARPNNIRTCFVLPVFYYSYKNLT